MSRWLTEEEGSSGSYTALHHETTNHSKRSKVDVCSERLRVAWWKAGDGPSLAQAACTVSLSIENREQ